VAEVTRITEAQLADMLKGFRLAVRTEDGGLVNGEIHVPDNVALHVFRSVRAAHEGERDPRAPGPDDEPSRGTLPHWTEITRDELAAFLAKLRVGIEQQEDWKMGPTAMLSRPQAVADAIASHSHGLRLNEAAERDDVIDAHVHCDHVLTSRADSELAIADQVITLLQPLGYAGSRRLKRVLRWAWDYLADGDEPPF
jgi:hypothetical protein